MGKKSKIELGDDYITTSAFEDTFIDIDFEYDLDWSEDSGVNKLFIPLEKDKLATYIVKKAIENFYEHKDNFFVNREYFDLIDYEIIHFTKKQIKFMINNLEIQRMWDGYIEFKIPIIGKNTDYIKKIN